MNYTNHLFTTPNYDIIAVDSPDKSESRQKYGVINNKTSVIEFYVDTFDNAMIAAETLNYIITNATWKAQVEVNIESIKRDSKHGIDPQQFSLPLSH
jgi:hypothetical protein